MVLAGTRKPPKHNESPYGELPPPPAVRISQLDSIQRKPEAGEWSFEGVIEAIHVNR